ncbi:Transcriptional regulator [Frankia sp. AiPs1]|uniref:LysR family transcriptional regulator n=1 Tax=Frankia sp. AiPa1 TaxID=573492 RepID=UPI00202AC405|nr:LysR family transcriptional regulator [Frankia sp. AiPa1]MCL9762447.1 LysR family transcriptional regulator [Frankia sp. AiPa1]
MRGWLNLRQASYFVVVAQEGSFTRAARRLHLAQPSLSQQIHALEVALGAELFERTARGVRLTAAGQAFLDGVPAALAAAESAVGRARSAAGQGGGSLHVAAVSSLSTWVLPRAVAHWRPAHPGTALRITEFPARGALEEFVAAGRADVGIGPRPASWSGPLWSLGAERFAVVVPPGDPYAGRTGVALAAFAERDWVLYASEHGLAQVVAQACAVAGFQPRGVVETHQVDAAVRLAAAGLGVALVPGPAVPSDQHIGRVDLADPPLRDVVAYARIDGWSQAGAVVRGFVDLLRTLDLGLVRPDRPASGQPS